MRKISEVSRHTVMQRVYIYIYIYTYAHIYYTYKNYL